MNVKPWLPEPVLKQDPSLRFLHLNASWVLLGTAPMRLQPEVIRHLCPCHTKPTLFSHHEPHKIPELDPLKPIVLKRFIIEYPGPCGRAMHTFWAGLCDRCDIVYWMMGPMTTLPWGDMELLEIATAQENDLTSFEPRVDP